jgi:hypothetical protein
MGCNRVGWYSYDDLYNGGVPSAETIVRELQRVQVGDVFPWTERIGMASSSGWSKPTGTFEKPSEALVAEKERFGASRSARWFGL